jgi:hypothetical protein
MNKSGGGGGGQVLVVPMKQESQHSQARHHLKHEQYPKNDRFEDNRHF